MSDIFGKVVAILLCAWLMFLCPLQQMKEENQQLEHMYLYQETVRFLDAVRNTGMITSEAWIAYQKKISNMNELYQISISHEQMEYQNLNGEQAEYQYYYDAQIKEQLDTQGKYVLAYNDFVKIVVEDAQKNMVVCYGGSVKTGGENETD